MRKGISSDAYTTIVRVVTCAVTLAAYFTVSLLFKSGYVPSGSMYPTYNLGDICFYSRIFPVENISHEDIVLFCPATKANIDMGYSVSDVFVKRVIGMPGDTIEVADGHLYVNGQVQDRDYTAEPGTAGTFGPVTVPENSLRKHHREGCRTYRESHPLSFGKRICLASLSEHQRAVVW